MSGKNGWSYQSNSLWFLEYVQLTANLPRLGLVFPARILRAVDLPIPFVPTSPRTSPGRGTGRRCNLNEFFEYRCVVFASRLLGKLMIEIALNGHFWNENQERNERNEDCQYNSEQGRPRDQDANHPSMSWTLGSLKLHLFG